MLLQVWKRGFVLVVFLVALPWVIWSQGPPISGDKPIMLGAKRKVVKTLSEIRVMEDDDVFARLPLMFHYLPTSDMLTAIHLPLLVNEAGMSLGDLDLMYKYQYFRKDGKAKTFRMVAKAVQTFPTGKDVDNPDIGIKAFQTYIGTVAGYETIKYGISGELGFKLVFDEEHSHVFRQKLGFGLPLLKPAYPVNQLNLYFEYQSDYFTENRGYRLLYAQGIQYAKGQWTYEVSAQFPLVQNVPDGALFKYAFLLGTRYVF